MAPFFSPGQKKTGPLFLDGEFNRAGSGGFSSDGLFELRSTLHPRSGMVKYIKLLIFDIIC
ncbi:hypothetical protein DCCM_3699 [Desulfocucumis palustris]|uniref:Uncharacterized protein n=1 Tax=Desulfocucumis palustris TaxID=1898651 RepID=A0A2L2XEJ2_9FIRM|nr:hypothetical protein DCCM_3699 [Desulfocucumis palustris]